MLYDFYYTVGKGLSWYKIIVREIVSYAMYRQLDKLLKKTSYSRTPPNNGQVSAINFVRYIGRFYHNYKVTLPQMCNSDFKYTICDELNHAIVFGSRLTTTNWQNLMGTFDTATDWMIYMYIIIGWADSLAIAGEKYTTMNLVCLYPSFATLLLCAICTDIARPQSLRD